MRIISRKRLVEFGVANADAVKPLDRWYRIARRAEWSRFQDVRQTFSSADSVRGKHRTFVVFDIKGPNYRMSTVIYYNTGRVYIRRVMTHPEYDENKWKDD